MKPLKFILLAVVFSLTIVSCVKTDLNEDESMLNSSDVIYATGGQSDEDGGLE